jgi:GNAT superfamily N-acetyltransferase
MSTTTPRHGTLRRDPFPRRRTAVAARPAPAGAGVSRVRVADGRLALIRPARLEDRPLFVAALDGLSAQSRYQRFLTPVPRLPARDINRLMDLDAAHQVVLHATDEPGTALVGVARFVFTAAHEAELAVTVGDCWQRQGLGGALLDRLVAAARQCDVSRLTGEAPSENRAIAGLLRSRGFQPSGPVSVTVGWSRSLSALRPLARPSVALEFRHQIALCSRRPSTRPYRQRAQGPARAGRTDRHRPRPRGDRAGGRRGGRRRRHRA